MDPAEEVVYLKLKIPHLEREVDKLRAALARVSDTIPRRVKQHIEGALVVLAPLRRLLVTLEADPTVEGFAEARELVRSATKLLDEALDGK